jgi:uncharacterized protein DUF3455
MNKILVTLLAAGITLEVNGCGIARPDVPDSLKAPAGEKVILVGHATGVQIYVCQSVANAPFAWTLTGPEADLTDSSGRKIIHHFAGPTWKHNDGSEVVGKKVAQEEATKPDAIPWLLLKATSHAGQGVLTRVTSIQRIHTDGGVTRYAETCNASTNGKEFRSPYSADYYFYAPKK